MTAKELQLNSVRLKEHITHGSGAMKTVCVTAVLTALGIDERSYSYTWSPKRGNMWKDVLRRQGYAVRSRKSKLSKYKTVGAVRKALKTLEDPQGVNYIVQVDAHLMLLTPEGNTVIDTAPRKRDKRKIVQVLAVWKNI